jgi:hypothetical protein
LHRSASTSLQGRRRVRKKYTPTPPSNQAKPRLGEEALQAGCQFGRRAARQISFRRLHLEQAPCLAAAGKAKPPQRRRRRLSLPLPLQRGRDLADHSRTDDDGEGESTPVAMMMMPFSSRPPTGYPLLPHVRARPRPPRSPVTSLSITSPPLVNLSRAVARRPDPGKPSPVPRLAHLLPTPSSTRSWVGAGRCHSCFPEQI